MAPPIPPAITPPVVALEPRACATELVALQRDAYAVEARLIGSDAIPGLRESAASLVAARLSWWGCRDGPELLGAIAVAPDGSDIERLMVSPRAFRRGIGSTLVAHVLDRTDRAVTVSTGRANTPARTLYERLGFVLLGFEEVEPGLELARYVRPA